MNHSIQSAISSTIDKGRKKMTDLTCLAAALPGDAIERAIVAASAEALLKPCDVAEKLAVSERTLERWRMTGEGPEYISLSRKTVRYTAASLERFITDRARTNTAQS